MHIDQKLNFVKKLNLSHCFSTGISEWTCIKECISKAWIEKL